MQFIYVLLGWEGSTSDSRVLRDAVSRPNGLKVPTGMKIIYCYKYKYTISILNNYFVTYIVKPCYIITGHYYLEDAGYTNREGFLAPYM